MRFQQKLPFYIRSISHSQFFSQFWKSSDFFEKPLFFFAKRHFQEILPFYPHLTSNLLPFQNIFFSKTPTFKRFHKKLYYLIRILRQICYNLVIKKFQTFKTHISCNWQVNFENVRVEFIIFQPIEYGRNATDVQLQSYIGRKLWISRSRGPVTKHKQADLV